MTAKRILYFGASSDRFHRLVMSMARGVEIEREDRGLRFSHPRADLVWVPAFTTEAAMQVLDESYINLVLIDLRDLDSETELDEHLNSSRCLLRALDDVDDLETRYGFHRILVLVPEGDGDRVNRLLVELGGYGVRHALAESESDIPFPERVIERALELMLDRQPHKMALCAAGGGITAIFFELGAIKCLDDCLPEGTVNNFDMYFGISAGAVVTSLIANGYSADEFMAALAGVEGGRVPPLNLSLVRLGHLNYADYLRRFGYLARRSGQGLWKSVRGRGLPTVDGIFLELTGLVGAPFKSDRFEAVLRDILTAPGCTNDFRSLKNELYVGASNQDARRHVLFGADKPDTPISIAVQASLSINPAFSAVEIDGTWYEDGAVTRTSNFVEAIKRDANLIFVLDPFVPYVSKDPGFANRRGMLFNIDQDVRSLSYTRYENTRNWALRRYPEVSSYTFLPNNRLRRLLSVNPMDHRGYLPIFRASYLATLNRLRQIQHRLAGDLAVHGLRLNLSRAEAIAERLENADPPRFEDFFADGRVEIRRPPLALEA